MTRWLAPLSRRSLPAWGAAVVLGVVVGAVAVVPLGFYLTRSPVWTDRAEAKRPAWDIVRPRVLDAICTAFPYAFGSQRRGQPNLAKALGVHNLNESAGGFAGLATLIWLAPAAWAMRRRLPRIGFLAGLAGFGAMAAFRLPPADNLLRALPVLNVTDNRRLTLWLAFGLLLLGGAGIDHLRAALHVRGWRLWTRAWILAAACMLVGAMAIGWARPRIEARAQAHYAKATADDPALDPTIARERAARQVRQTMEFLPRYLVFSAAHLLALAALAAALRSGKIGARPAQALVSSLVLADLFGFGLGLNPAILREQERPVSPLVAYLRREVGSAGRILPIGAELPPNTLMRYGLSDIRNYDSVELAASLAWFAPLYENASGRAARTSRRTITWQGVLRARDRLEKAGVMAVISAVPPPAGGRAFARVDRVGGVWVARLEARPLVAQESGQQVLSSERQAGEVRATRAPASKDDRVIIRETFDAGWRAEVDGKPRAVEVYEGAFLSVRVRAGERELRLRYDPLEVRASVALSVMGLAFSLAIVLAGRASTRKKPVIGLDAFERSSYNRCRDLHRTSQPVCH